MRVISAGLHLQALVLKHQRVSRREIKKVRKFKEVLKSTPLSSLSLEGVNEKLQEFMGQNIFKILKDNSLVPDRHTYEVINIINYNSGSWPSIIIPDSNNNYCQSLNRLSCC